MAATRVKRPYKRREPEAVKVAPKPAMQAAEPSIQEIPAVGPQIAQEPVRAPMRAEMREDPRARAARKAAEIRDHLGGHMDDGTDKYYIDERLIPPGWSYEWKRKSVMNQEDPAYAVNLARHGWDPVPADRHPDYMPAGHKGQTIERDGLILMERPKEITDEVVLGDKKKAAMQMRQKLDSTMNQPSGPNQFERQTRDGERLSKINRTFEHIPIPE